MSKIKICGLSRVEDIDSVNQALPDFIGFVFAESRRVVDRKTAAMLKRHLDAKITAVGVFADQKPDLIAEIFEEGTIDMIQLHGNEDEEYIKLLREYCACPVIKAIRFTRGMPRFSDSEAKEKTADYFLFDSEHGGSGNAFDWNLLNGYCGSPYFLAGGLTAETLEYAVRLLRPFCVDISSGAETDGKKDNKKIAKLVNIIRSVI